LSLSNLALADGETVQAVELTFTTPVAGDWYWACDAVEGTHSLTDYGASSTLTINTSSTTDIWFGCAPVDVSGEIMAVRVYTSAGVWERYVEFPSGRKFEAGQVAVFGVNMASAEFKPYGSGSGDFTLVTDAGTLSAGDEIIIANTDGDKALGSNTGSYREAVDITSNGSEITDAGQAVVLKLEAGSSSGTWAFKAGDGYLATSSSKNSLTVSNAVGATSSWSVSIVGGDATVVAQSGTYNHLCYNSGAPRFSGYKSTSNMAAVAIYRRSGTASALDPAADALLAKTVYGCYLGSGLEWEYNPGSDQICRSYSSDGTLTFTLINPEGVEELEITGYKSGYLKGDQATLNVNWRRGTRSVLSQSYKMTIIREDGPKLWLSDGAGKGFIIKK
ncbi:MAG: hypothetical protein IJS70_09395, partial [Bacteroidales bacterium]|nr:hypothetical protein [Bacteroidales bacterium]